MVFELIYMLLNSISIGTYHTVVGVWKVEEWAINFMMTCFLFALRVACHPLLVVPVLLFAIYSLRNFWQRRRKSVVASQDGEVSIMSPTPRTFSCVRSPRIRSNRSLGNKSTRSNDSRDASEEDRTSC